MSPKCFDAGPKKSPLSCQKRFTDPSRAKLVLPEPQRGGEWETWRVTAREQKVKKTSWWLTGEITSLAAVRFERHLLNSFHSRPPSSSDDEDFGVSGDDVEEEDTPSDVGSLKSLKHSKHTLKRTKNWRLERTLHKGKKQPKQRQRRSSEEDSDEETGESDWLVSLFFFYLVLAPCFLASLVSELRSVEQRDWQRRRPKKAEPATGSTAAGQLLRDVGLVRSFLSCQTQEQTPQQARKAASLQRLQWGSVNTGICRTRLSVKLSILFPQQPILTFLYIQSNA